MKLGAEPRKVGILAVLIIAAGYLLYTNLFSGGPPDSATAPQPSRNAADAPAALPLPEAGRPAPRSDRAASARASLQEFRPSLKPKRGEERRDLSAIDPTLRLDLLARLQEVKLEGGDRTLFEFSAEPLPKTPEPKIIPKKAVYGPAPPPPPGGENKTAESASKPPPPPIPLKFFGYITQARQGAKRAFFLDGDDILVASEGDLVKKRYRIVRVGVNSVVVEDIDFKNEQTLPLEAQAAG